jgi:hypothetical protein
MPVRTVWVPEKIGEGVMPSLGAFASSARQLASHGLAVLPLGGDDGKKALVRGYNRWKHGPGADSISKLAAKNPTANVGIICGLSGVTVLDIDYPSIADDLMRVCGDTPLKVRTPSGGVHLYYDHNGERNANLRSQGFEADVKGKAGIIAAPPSTRPDSGRSYTFIEGGWEDLVNLPPFNPIDMAAPDKPIQVTNSGADAVNSVTAGQRNDTLFREALRGARNCATVDDILLLARSINEGFSPSLSYAEVTRAAMSAWKIHHEGNNWNGQEEGHVSLPISLWSLFDEKPDALSLFGHLLANHGVRHEPFAISPKAMAASDVLRGWERRRYERSRDWLLEARFLTCVHKGGSKPGDPSYFTFGPTYSKGDNFCPQYNYNTPPRPLPSI